MNQVRHWIGFEENMDRLGDREQPVGVCILDSGVEAHPDFGKRIVLFRDFVEERQGLYDDYGHGTHIAGISSGSGLRSKGRYRGIAAHSNLIIGKVQITRATDVLRTLSRQFIGVCRCRKNSTFAF